jgi:hypothetical protein
VTVQLNGGRQIKGGAFVFVVHAASVLRPSGVQDLAGNALDGEFYGLNSASGNGVPGGDYVARLVAFHNIVRPPRTIIGVPHPNDPVGHFAKGKHAATTRSQPIAVQHVVPKVSIAMAHRGSGPGNH